MLTATQKYAAGALFGLALHQAQIHQTRPLGFPYQDDDEDGCGPSEELGSCSSSADSVSEDPQLWVNRSCGLLRPVFMFLEIDDKAWAGLEETAGHSEAKQHFGAIQASRQWNHKFADIMLLAGYRQSQHDHSLFVKSDVKGITLLIVYVDDIIITGSHAQSISELKDFLHSKLKIRDIGALKYFLGLEVARSAAGIYLSQRKYSLELIAEAGVAGARPYDTPMEQNKKLTSQELDHIMSSGSSTVASDPLLLDSEPYKRLVGRLIYLTITRPDLCYAVQTLSQFMNSPKHSHMEAAIRVVKYIKLNPGLGIFLPANSSLHLEAFCDSDWGACPMSRRSLTGFCIKLGDSLLSWRTKKQSTVSRSSAEAEYRAMAATTCEIVWISGLLADMGVHLRAPATLFCDNQAALHIAANPIYHERTKHIEIDCHIVRERVKDGTIKTAHISTTQQLADLFTKGLGRAQHWFLLCKLGVRDLHQP